MKSLLSACSTAAVLLSSLGLSHAQSTPRFEVVSIKPSAPDAPAMFSPLPGGKLSARNQSVVNLAKWAFQVDVIENSVTPAWLWRDGWDIEAVPASPISRDEVPLAVRAVLIERFKLATHVEKREISGYALRMSSGGVKLKVAPPRGEGERWGFVNTNEKTTARDVAISDLLRLLSGPAGKQIVDETGLDKRYDFVLQWDHRPLDKATADSDPSNPIAGVSIFSALETQLGLKLESAKFPKDVLVIDHIERPSPN